MTENAVKAAKWTYDPDAALKEAMEEAKRLTLKDFGDKSAEKEDKKAKAAADKALKELTKWKTKIDELTKDLDVDIAELTQSPLEIAQAKLEAQIEEMNSTVERAKVAGVDAAEIGAVQEKINKYRELKEAQNNRDWVTESHNMEMERLQALEDSYGDYYSNIDAMRMAELENYKQQLAKMLESDKLTLESQRSELQSKKADLDAQNSQMRAKQNELNSSVAAAQMSAAEAQQAQKDAQAAIESDEMNYEAVKKQIQKMIAAAAASKPTLSFTGFICPLKSYSRISSEYGWRKNPVTGVNKLHAGTDFAAPGGTPIYAAASGYVQVAGWSSGGYGNYVIIYHGKMSDGNQYSTLYGHMRSVATSAGKYVQQGEIIGYVGSTGNSTGNHLHLEVWKGGSKANAVNPRGYIPMK